MGCMFSLLSDSDQKKAYGTFQTSPQIAIINYLGITSWKNHESIRCNGSQTIDNGDNLVSMTKDGPTTTTWEEMRANPVTLSTGAFKSCSRFFCFLFFSSSPLDLPSYLFASIYFTYSLLGTFMSNNRSK